MSTELRALLALLLGAVGIGFAPIAVRLVEINPVASAFWRLLLATPLLWLLARGTGQSRGLVAGPPRLAWLAGLMFAADLGVWHYSIHYTSVANATLLANLAPVFIALWSLLVWRQRLLGRYWLGLGLALAGAAVLVGANLGRREALLGDGLGVLTALFYAAYQLCIVGARRDMGTWQLMWISSAVAALALLPFAVAAGPWWPAGLHDWLWLLSLALISHVLGQGLIAYALAHLPAAFSSVSLLLQPVAAAAFAWWILLEPLGAQQAAGAAVVLFGILLCRRPLKPA